MNKIVILIAFAILLTSAQAECNDCVLKITPVSNNLCQGDVAVYDIEITNIYPTSKAITLSVDSDIPLTSNLTSQIVVGPYAKRKIRVEFRPVQYVLGEHQICITASGYGSEDVDYALFAINDCYEGSLKVDNSAILCRDTQGRVDFTVSNTGSESDTYRISYADVPSGFIATLPQDKVTLAPGTSQKLSILVSAGNVAYGNYDMYVTINSLDSPSTKDIKLTVMDCHSPTLQVQEVFESCPLEGKTYYVNIKNDRPLTNEFYLSLSGTCDASLAKSRVELGSGESAQVAVNLGSRTGECDVTVKAENQFTSISKTTHVIMWKCYDVDLEIIPPEWTVCNGEDVTYDLRVTNKGYYPDNYVLDLIGLDKEIQNDQMYLNPGQSQTTFFEVLNTWCTTDDIPFTVTASGHASDSENGQFTIIDDPAYCSDISIKPAKNTFKLDCGVGAYSILIKNSGYEGENVMVYVDSPIGHMVQPETVFIKPTETREVALYPMPPEGFVGNFTFEVMAKGEHKSDSMTMYASVSDGKCIVSVAPLWAKDEDSGQDGTVVIASDEGTDIEDDTSTAEDVNPSGAATSANGGWDLLVVILLLCVLALFILLFLGWSKGDETAKGDYFPEVGTTQQDLDVKRREAIKEAITKTSL